MLPLFYEFTKFKESVQCVPTEYLYIYNIPYCCDLKYLAKYFLDLPHRPQSLMVTGVVCPMRAENHWKSGNDVRFGEPSYSTGLDHAK